MSPVNVHGPGQAKGFGVQEWYVLPQHPLACSHGMCVGLHPPWLEPPPVQDLLCSPPLCAPSQGQRMVKWLQSSDFQPLASLFAARSWLVHEDKLSLLLPHAG